MDVEKVHLTNEHETYLLHNPWYHLGIEFGGYLY